MGTSDQLAFQGINELVIEMLENNKANLMDIEIHDIGSHYTLQLKTKLLKKPHDQKPSENPT